MRSEKYIAHLYSKFSWLINNRVTVLLVRSRYQENYLSPDYLEAPGQMNLSLSGTIKFENPVFFFKRDLQKFRFKYAHVLKSSADAFSMFKVIRLCAYSFRLQVFFIAM